MPTVGARPDELRRLATVLLRAIDEVAWLRRRIDDAQDRARVRAGETRILARLEGWLAEGAVDLRRRAMRLEDGWIARGVLMDDFHPPIVTVGGCGSVHLPVVGRRAEPGGGDTTLGAPLFASAPLTCVASARTAENGPLVIVAPNGTLVLTSRGKNGGEEDPGGGPGGTGTPPLSKRGKLKKAKLPISGPFRFRPDPRNTLKWDSEQLAYVDRFQNRWRKGPSRTPGQPFEWDVQLDPSSAWTKYSKDGKHLNVNLDGYLSH